MQKLIQAALLVFLAGAACDGGRTVPAGCGQTSACGGDIVGDWKFAGSCVDTAALAKFYRLRFQTSCAPEVTVTDNARLTYAPTTVSFNADRTYAGRFVMNGTIGIHIPTACLAGTCSDMRAQVLAMVGSGGDLTEASCSETATSCSCSLTLGRVSDRTGTYTADGVSLTLENGQGPGSNAHYCVTEPELRLMTYLPTSTAQDTPLVFAAEIVLVRQ